MAYLAVNLTTAVSWVTERIGALSTAGDDVEVGHCWYLGFCCAFW
jgi:hypothetical protein